MVGGANNTLDLNTVRRRSVGLTRDADTLLQHGPQRKSAASKFRVPSMVGSSATSKDPVLNKPVTDIDAEIYADPKSSSESDDSSELSSVPSSISGKSSSSRDKRKREDANSAVPVYDDLETETIWGKSNKRPKQTYGSAKYGSKSATSTWRAPGAPSRSNAKQYGKKGKGFQEPSLPAPKTTSNKSQSRLRKAPSLSPDEDDSPTSPQPFQKPTTLADENTKVDNNTQPRMRSTRNSRKHGRPRSPKKTEATEQDTSDPPDSSGGFKAPESGFTPRKKPTHLKISVDAESGSSLSSPPDSVVLSQRVREDSSELMGSDSESLGKSVCPMCRTVLDPDFLQSNGFGSRSRLNIREQAAICHAHKKHTALAEYQAKGYPLVSWDALERRLAAATPHIHAILDGSTPSTFRDELSARVDGGRQRTLLQSVNSEAFAALTPGYYGTRGARALGAFVTREFSERLRELAPRDRLIAAGGVSGYVQAVLVPELAAWLVERDMRVGPGRAREILKESIALGDLVNEEVEDEIEVVDEQIADDVDDR